MANIKQEFTKLDVRKLQIINHCKTKSVKYFYHTPIRRNFLLISIQQIFTQKQFDIDKGDAIGLPN